MEPFSCIRYKNSDLKVFVEKDKFKALPSEEKEIEVNVSSITRNATIFFCFSPIVAKIAIYGTINSMITASDCIFTVFFIALM